MPDIAIYSCAFHATYLRLFLPSVLEIIWTETRKKLNTYDRGSCVHADHCVHKCCCFRWSNFFTIPNASRQLFTCRTFMKRASFIEMWTKNSADWIVKQATKTASIQQATRMKRIIEACVHNELLSGAKKKLAISKSICIDDQNFVIIEIKTERIITKPILMQQQADDEQRAFNTIILHLVNIKFHKSNETVFNAGRQNYDMFMNPRTRKLQNKTKKSQCGKTESYQEEIETETAIGIHFSGSRTLNAQVMFILTCNECWWSLIPHTFVWRFFSRLVLFWHLTAFATFSRLQLGLLKHKPELQLALE